MTPYYRGNGFGSFATGLGSQRKIGGAGHCQKYYASCHKRAQCQDYGKDVQGSSGSLISHQTVYNEIIPVETISNVKPANLYRMDRPDLISAFTKIELWRQTQFRTIVYLDADVVAIRAPNELLNSDAHLSAVPDVGWPDCFNSGMLVLQPNMGDYYSLLALAERGISFDGADQGLLNMHFRRWHRLSFTYNCTPSGSYQYVPAYKHFHSSISLVHFIGREKPWKMGRNAEGSSEVFEELLGRWWAVYDRYYHCRVSLRHCSLAHDC